MAICRQTGIIVVILVGVLKLWLANRRLQAHEVIDEERRARVAQMRYCGIRHMSYNSIPFGARAIEQGQEVEGIWNSCRGVSAISQTTPLATLADDDDDDEDGAQHEGLVASSRLHEIHEETARTANPSSSLVTHSSAASSTTYHDCRSTGHPDDEVDDLAIQPIQTVRRDSKTRKSSTAHEKSLRVTVTPLMSSPPSPQAWEIVTNSNMTPSPHSSRAPRHPVRRAHGPAQVYANTEIQRRMSSGFEILPAGRLGARPEFPDSSRTVVQQADQKPGCGGGRKSKKLQKPRL
ncbi:hypothetical protein E4U41_005127 [Claviceps citrina]|nr:hypothetical protein E4U41_005127 [Claviceps citrina]